MPASDTPYLAAVRRMLAEHVPRAALAPGARPAAVLLLLYAEDGEDRLLLTQRTETLAHHRGQISFPGGGVHAEDSDRAATALRETWEEVGVWPEDVELLGRLDDLATNSNFLVTPWVGRLRRVPYPFALNAHEVAHLIEPPLAHLLDPATLAWEEYGPAGARRTLPAYYWEGHRIWGVTAIILHGFLGLLRGALAGEAVR